MEWYAALRQLPANKSSSDQVELNVVRNCENKTTENATNRQSAMTLKTLLESSKEFMEFTFPVREKHVIFSTTDAVLTSMTTACCS